MFNFKKPVAEQSTAEFINLADIRGNFLYTKDNYVYQYIKVMPVSTDLMSDAEKKQLTVSMTRELSPLGVPFKILFLSRPTDVTQIINYYEGIRAVTTSTLKRDSLKKTMNFLSQAATSGGILERQTFIALWIDKSKQNEDELYAKTIEFVNALRNTGVIASVCDETEIANMIGLFYNPVFQKIIYDTTPNYTFFGGDSNEK